MHAQIIVSKHFKSVPLFHLLLSILYLLFLLFNQLIEYLVKLSFIDLTGQLWHVFEEFLKTDFTHANFGFDTSHATLNIEALLTETITYECLQVLFLENILVALILQLLDIICD